MSERSVNASPPEPAARDQPDAGVLKCLFDHLVFEQHERGARGTWRSDVGISPSQHPTQALGNACCHAMLKAERGTTESNPLEPLTVSTKVRRFGPDSAIDDLQQIGRQ